MGRTLRLALLVGVVLGAFEIAKAEFWPVADRPPNHSPANVSLTEDGGLIGHYIDHNGHNIDGAIIVVRRAEGIVTKTNTDREGRFLIYGLTPGTYELQAGVTSRKAHIKSMNNRSVESREVLVIRCDELAQNGLWTRFWNNEN